VRAIETVVEGEKLPLPERPPGSGVEDSESFAKWFRVAWIILVLLIIFARTPLLWSLFGIPGFRRYGSYTRGPFGGGGGFGGGGFGGGGGFSGGGGSFGGGGASGRW